MFSNVGREAIRRVVAGGQQSTNRAFQCTFHLRRVEKSDRTIPAPKFALYIRRSYATTTATKDSAKKTATAKKTSTAKPKAKKAATTKAVKKPAKKKKRVAKAAKPKPKKKPVKKVLTDNQKSALAAKIARANLKELKEKALSAPKSQPASVWQIILREHTKKKAAELGTPVSDNTKTASVVYKSLTPEQIEASFCEAGRSSLR
jgi:outer membrane biosynthesis protein TonB